MRNLVKIIALISILSAPLQLFAQGDSSQQEVSSQKAKNVILMIGDGMGFNQHFAGAYWRYGGPGNMSYEKFPFHCGCTHFSSLGKEIPDHYPGYDPKSYWISPANADKRTELTQTTDSAAAITSLQTGVKTISGRLGVDVDKKPLELVAQVAQKAGKSTGAVSTVITPHATPGGVFAHNAGRDAYVDIFNEMTAENGLTVVMGAGHPHYDSNGKSLPKEQYEFRTVGGEDTWDEMTGPNGRNGYTFIEAAQDFEKLAETKENIPAKVIGIARIMESIPPIDGTPSVCPPLEEIVDKALEGLQTKDVPTLSTMSLAALNVLSQNENGFYLMIEGGAIDWACHGNFKERLLMEQAGFTKAIDVVVNWVEENSSWDETVLIVTADHETGLLWGSGTFIDKDGDGKYKADKDEFVAFQPVTNEGCGKMPGLQFLSGSHTNSLVPVWGIGVGIEELEKSVYGIDEQAAKMWNFSGKYIDNTDIGKFLKSKM